MVVIQLNINNGYNEELLDRCPTLCGYMKFVDKVRSYEKMMPKESAIHYAVESCIEEGILKKFLLKNKAEVISMCIFEYDEELHEKTLLEIGRNEGKIEGKIEGETKLLINLVCKKLRRGKAMELIADELELEINRVQEIGNVACQFAPDYDVEKIFEKLQSE